MKQLLPLFALLSVVGITMNGMQRARDIDIKQSIVQHDISKYAAALKEYLQHQQEQTHKQLEKEHQKRVEALNGQHSNR